MFYDPLNTSPADNSFCSGALKVEIYINDVISTLTYSLDYSLLTISIDSLIGATTYTSAVETLKIVTSDKRDDTGSAGQANTF